MQTGPQSTKTGGEWEKTVGKERTILPALISALQHVVKEVRLKQNGM